MAKPAHSPMDVIRALDVVQTTLDALTERGKHEAAFRLAKVQFAASVRSSWPGNLTPLVAELEALAGDASAGLTPEERSKIEGAILVLRP